MYICRYVHNSLLGNYYYVCTVSSYKCSGSFCKIVHHSLFLLVRPKEEEKEDTELCMCVGTLGRTYSI